MELYFSPYSRPVSYSLRRSVLSPLSRVTSVPQIVIKSVALSIDLSMSSTTLLLSLWLYGLS